MDLSSIVREPGLLFLISQYLDSMLTGFDAFSRVAAVSKDWLHAFQGDDMWRMLCEARWPGMTAACQVDGGYKNLFQRLNVQCDMKFGDIKMILENGQHSACFDLGLAPLQWHDGFGRYLELALPTKWKLEYDEEEWTRQNQEWIETASDPSGGYAEDCCDWAGGFAGALICKRGGKAVALTSNRRYMCWERATMDDPNGFLEVHWAELPVKTALRDDVRESFGLPDPEETQYYEPVLCVSLAFIRNVPGVLGLKLGFKEYAGNEAMESWREPPRNLRRAGEALLPYLHWI
jgi:hypothetical protein